VSGRVCAVVMGAALAACALFAPFSLGAAGTSLPSCTTSQLVPAISEIAVDQGLPQGGSSYARLARGKEALVRVYLTTPTSCALTKSQKIEPQSATLAVNNSVTTSNLTNVDPLAAALAAGQQISATSDPYFDVAGSLLAPANGGAAFNATFTAQVNYKSTNGTTVVTGTTSASAANAVKTVAVDRRTNAIRVLVMPFGDPTAATTQFTTAANSSVQQLMAAVARVFPVQDGATANLTSTSGGVRYRVNGGLLDAKSLGLFVNGKMCSNGTNYSASLVTSGPFLGLTLKGQLLQALSDYNSVNAAAPADVILGVADESIAWASSSGTQCPAAPGFSPGAPDDGRASTPAAGVLGKPAWARITYPTSAGGSGGPSPVVMEIAHNYGISRCCASFHSSNQQSDVTAPNHAMNLLQRKVLYGGGTLGEDHSAMNYNTVSPAAIPYTADNVVLEPNDWADVLCDLGGVASATAGSCPLGSTVGTSTGVAANAFDINGTTDGSNVRVTNSYGTSLDQGLQTQGDPDSTTRLLLSNGTSCSSPGTTLLDFGLPVQRDEAHTAGDITGSDELTKTGFHALVPRRDGTSTVRVVVNGTVKYCRSAAAPPDVTDAGVATNDMGSLLRSFSMPGGGSNGRGIAFDSKTNTLYGTFADFSNPDRRTLVEFRTDGSLVRTAELTASVGALTYDSGRDVLYGGNLHSGLPSADDGKVYSISTGESPAITSTLFQVDLSADPTCRGGNPGAIDGLDYLPSSDSFVLSGDAARRAHFVKRDGTITDTFDVAAAESDCNSGVAKDGSGGIWLALLGDSGSTTTTFVHRTSAGTVDKSFTVPDFQAEDIDYDPVTFAPRCALWANPATGGTPQIRAYSVPCAAASGPVVTFTATGNNLVGTAWVTCGSGSPLYPAADSLSPADTDAAVKSFSFAFAPTLACGNGTPQIVTAASNGVFQSSPSDSDAATQVNSSPKNPIATINAPVDNTYHSVGSKVRLNGSGFDYEDGAIAGQNLSWSVDGSGVGSGSSLEYTAAAGDHTITLVATDSSGAQSAPASVTIHADGTPPVLTLTPGATAGSELVSASDNAAGDTGLANVFCSTNGIPATLTPPFAPTATYDGAFSYSAATIQQLSCTAYDRAGNETTVNTISQYQPAGQDCGGFPGKTVLQPINPDNSSVFKKGSIVPVKFTVCDGTGPVGPSAVVDVARTPPPVIPSAFGGDGTTRCPETPPTPLRTGVPVLCKVSGGSGAVDEVVISNTPDTVFRFSSPQWIFNLATDNLASPRTYTYYIPLNDDTNIFFQFGLK
jgi:hypothetical protein